MASNEQSAAPITNTLFPPPPEYFEQFTDENLARFEHLSSAEAGPSRSTTSDNAGTGARAELSDAEKEELERLRSTLGPPRADWIKEEGRWVTFGEMYTVSLLFPW
jgi:mediator of RNA polymerase II transcription subunit 7